MITQNTPTPRKHAATIKEWMEDDKKKLWCWCEDNKRWTETRLQFSGEFVEHYVVASIEKPTHTPQRMCKFPGTDIWFPEPIKEAPELGQHFYWASLEVDNYCLDDRWENSDIDRFLLNQHICHLNKEAAQAQGRALLQLNQLTLERSE